MKPRRRVVLDTNVFSYRLDKRSSFGELYPLLTAEYQLCITVVTLEEAWYGAEKAQWGPRRRRELESYISEHELLSADDDEIPRIAGLIRATRIREGRALSRSDAWIAATAIRNHLPLVSHDGDLLGIAGLQVISLLEMGVREPAVPCSVLRAA